MVVKAGDSIMVECIFETKNRSQPTFGGLATTQEMCTAVLYYYPKATIPLCGSFPSRNTSASLLGTFDGSIYTDPQTLRGKTWEEAATETEWTDALRERYAKLTGAAGATHVGSCFNGTLVGQWPDRISRLKDVVLPERRSVAGILPCTTDKPEVSAAGLSQSLNHFVVVVFFALFFLI